MRGARVRAGPMSGRGRYHVSSPEEMYVVAMVVVGTEERQAKALDRVWGPEACPGASGSVKR